MLPNLKDEITFPKEKDCKRLFQLYKRLEEKKEELVDAITADGWPRKMAEIGVQFHLKSWNPAEIIETASMEYKHLLCTTEASGKRLRLGTTLHVWPKLPGAGVTPLLYGIVAGVEKQAIRPSSSGTNFCTAFLTICQEIKGGAVERFTEDVLNSNFENVIVSGSDDTVNYLRSHMRIEGRLTGYGHRESLALFTLDEILQHTESIAKKLALDIVMWDQYGCFSPRRVVVVGDASVVDVSGFASALATEIGALERRWEAFPKLNEENEYGIYALRSQLISTANFTSSVWGPEVGAPFGYVTVGDDAALVERVVGDKKYVCAKLELPHTINIEIVSTLKEIRWPPPQMLQGVGVSFSDPDLHALQREAHAAGATRICQVGELQMPPGSWPHDGMPNLTPWLF